MSSNSLNINFGSQQYSPMKFSSMTFLSFFYLTLMGFQLIQSMKIDTYEINQSRADLVGYWFGFIVSCILALWLLQKGRIMLSSIILVGMLLAYMTTVHLLTAPSDSPISFMISRYGLLMWFILGLGFSAVLAVFQARKNRPIIKATILLVLGVLALFAGLFAVRVIQSPVVTISYQAVATSATILLFMFASILIVVWGRTLPLLLVCTYISFATIMVTAVVLLQSTGIIVIWLGIVIVLFGQKIRDSRLISKLAMVFTLLILAYIFAQSVAFEMIETTTRFASFYVSDGEFTSLTSRLEILRTFLQQFEVSPIFGHFKAQVVAGYDEGRFIHSLPFSFLTHTGLIGSSLVSIILFNLLYSRNPWRSEIEPSEKQLGILMWIVLGLGSISTFLTWPVFWFMVGVLCRRPAKIMS